MANEILRAVAWPISALAIALVLWWSGFLKAIGGRATKLSVMQFSIELATVERTNMPGLDLLRDPLASAHFPSDASSLLRELLTPDHMDYAIIDLGNGDRWLASRLFLFAEFLHRQRGLRCIVFVDDRESVSRRLVGIADPSSVRWGLASQFPWLESALATSYDLVYSQDVGAYLPLPSLTPPALPPKCSTAHHEYSAPDGKLDPAVAERVVNCFLAHPNIQWTTGGGTAPWVTATSAVLDSPSPANEWALIATEPTERWEHTPWIRGSELSRSLGPGVLLEDQWFADAPTAGRQRAVREVLARSGEFVAVVNDDRCFRRLVDRSLVVERIAGEQLE